MIGFRSIGIYSVVRYNVAAHGRRIYSVASEHGATSFDRHLAPELPTLAELLQRDGYFTAGFTANFVHVSERTGLHRGFEVWRSLPVRLEDDEGDSLFEVENPAGKMLRFRAPRADELNAELLRLLPAEIDRPVFLYVHYMDPHADYAPPLAWRERFERAPTPRWAGKAVSSRELVELAAGRSQASEAERHHAIDLYDAEIAAVDAGVGALLAALAERGLGDPAVVAITADHGEEFEDHGGWFHGTHLYRELLSVPLIFRDSRRVGGGERRREPVGLIDVAPTLLALAGVSPPDEMRGRPLLEPPGDGPPSGASRTLLAGLHPDSQFESHLGPRTQRLALQRWPWQLVIDRDGSATAYRLDEDPREQRPLGEGDPEVPARLFRDARRWVDTLDRRLGAGRSAPLRPEDLERLRSLGYVE